jgi:hypothetical protein
VAPPKPCRCLAPVGRPEGLGRGSVRAGIGRRGRATLRPSRGFPVGFATTHEPNGNAAISTSWLQRLSQPTNRMDQVPRFPNAAGAHVLSLATPKLATSQIAAVHWWVQAFWSKRPGSPSAVFRRHHARDRSTSRGSRSHPFPPFQKQRAASPRHSRLVSRGLRKRPDAERVPKIPRWNFLRPVFTLTSGPAALSLACRSIADYSTRR